MSRLVYILLAVVVCGFLLAAVAKVLRHDLNADRPYSSPEDAVNRRHHLNR